MKKLLYLLLFPLSSFAQITDANLNLEADTIRTETHGGRNTAQRVGRMFKNIISNKWNGGFNFTTIGTTGPATFSGGVLNIPNYAAGGGISNTAPNTYLMKSDGTNAITSDISATTSGAKTSLTSSGGQIAVVSDLYLGRTLSSGLGSTYTFGGYPTGISSIIGNNTSSVSAVTNVSRIAIDSNGPTPAIGFGVGMEFAAQNSTPAIVVGSGIATVATSVTPGSENFDFVIKNIVGGALTEALRVKSDGTLVANNIPVDYLFTTTGGGGTQTAATIATTSGKNVSFQVILVSNEVSGGTTGWGGHQKVEYVYKNVAGTLTSIGSSTVFTHTNDASVPTLTLGISGSNILIQVSPGAGVVYNCKIRVEKIDL